jgi:hypothetical protein
MIGTQELSLMGHDKMKKEKVCTCKRKRGLKESEISELAEFCNERIEAISNGSGYYKDTLHSSIIDYLNSKDLRLDAEE